MNNYDLSVIVVCRNNSSLIHQLDHTLTEALQSLGLKTEVIYVDSGSYDDTAYRLRKLVETPGDIEKKLIILRRDFGMTSAFKAGADHSKGKFILTVDPMLTIEPTEISHLLEEVEKGYDLVVAWRKRSHLGAFVRMRSRVINSITSRVLNLHLHDYGSPMRLMRRDILQDIHLHGETFAFLPVFAHVAGAQIAEVPVAYLPNRYIGREYTPRSYVTSLLDLITVWFFTRYANRPMHIFGSLGLLFIASAFVALFTAVLNRAFNKVSLIQTPLPTLAGVLLAMGLLTILLGLTTELLMRNYYEATGRPTYSVREVVSPQVEKV